MNASALKVYLQWRLIAFTFLGFASGLPLALTLSTLSIWLSEAHIDKTTIGIFALVGLPYSLKFLWAPFLDHFSIPLLGRLLGQRRSWILLTQLLLGLALIAMGTTDPVANTALLSVLAVAVAFCSASQDIAVDAFRIESLDEASYGAGAAIFVAGYRLGMLASSAGALYLASFMSWSAVYTLMALCLFVGMVTVLFSKEPKRETLKFDLTHSLVERFQNLAVGPFVDFMKRPQWLLILFFVVVYKLGDAFIGHMTGPFYLELGFSKIEIANISKVFGISATIFGGFVGGAVVYKIGTLRALLLGGFLQVATILLFALLALVGPNLAMLMCTIGAENFANGLALAAFVAYLSSLCSPGYTASQYALLSAFSSFARVFLTAGAGYVADHTSWPVFFVISSVLAVPGILALLWLTPRVAASHSIP